MSRPRTTKKPPKHDLAPWAENIVKLRHEYDWTQSELAERLGVNPSHIARVETGRYPPSLDFIIKLAKLFAVPVNELLISPSQLTERDQEMGLLIQKLQHLSDDQFQEFMRATRALFDGYKISIVIDPITVDQAFRSMFGPEKAGNNHTLLTPLSLTAHHW